MSNGDYIKIEKKSDGSLDPMGLPFWEYIYLRKSNVEFDMQVWFEGKIKDQERYARDYATWVLSQPSNTIWNGNTIYMNNSHNHVTGNMVNTAMGANGGIYITTSQPPFPSNSIPCPDEDDPRYMSEATEVRRDHKGLYNAVKVFKYFINTHEVTESEFKRVADLVGCNL